MWRLSQDQSRGCVLSHLFLAMVTDLLSALGVPAPRIPHRDESGAPKGNLVTRVVAVAPVNMANSFATSPALLAILNICSTHSAVATNVIAVLFAHG
jgi:hypothetical protein